MVCNQYPIQKTWFSFVTAQAPHWRLELELFHADDAGGKQY